MHVMKLQSFKIKSKVILIMQSTDKDSRILKKKIKPSSKNLNKLSKRTSNLNKFILILIWLILTAKSLLTIASIVLTLESWTLWNAAISIKLRIESL